MLDDIEDNDRNYSCWILHPRNSSVLHTKRWRNNWVRESFKLDGDLILEHHSIELL